MRGDIPGNAHFRVKVPCFFLLRRGWCMGQQSGITTEPPRNRLYRTESPAQAPLFTHSHVDVLRSPGFVLHTRSSWVLLGPLKLNGSREPLWHSTEPHLLDILLSWLETSHDSPKPSAPSLSFLVQHNRCFAAAELTPPHLSSYPLPATQT